MAKSCKARGTDFLISEAVKARIGIYLGENLAFAKRVIFPGDEQYTPISPAKERRQRTFQRNPGTLYAYPWHICAIGNSGKNRYAVASGMEVFPPTEKTTFT